MWQQYRKYLIPTQLFIFAMCAVLYYMRHMALPSVIAVFIVMQIGGLVGSWWGTRLKNKMNAQRDRLPLDRR
jgi:uncharacterized membrane protein YfcA